MPGNPLVRFDEGRVGRTARCRPLSYSTVIIVFQPIDYQYDAFFDRLSPSRQDRKDDSIDVTRS